MTSEQSKTPAEEAWDSLKDLVTKAEKEFHRVAPSVQKSLDSSVENAGKVFDTTMKSIGTRTEKEQLELLKAYRKFLGGQADFVDSRMKVLEERQRQRKDRPVSSAS